MRVRGGKDGRSGRVEEEIETQLGRLGEILLDFSYTL
jgi:hypothetical protein